MEPGDHFSGKGGHFAEDREGRLWIGTSGGLFLFDQKNKRLIGFDPLIPGISQGNIISVCKVYFGNRTKGISLWLGLYGGLGIFNTNDLTLQIIKNQPGKSESLLPGNLLSLYEDRSGCIWLGSNGFGLDKFSTRSALFPLPEYHTPDGSART
jgi:ligand-binding sensor domain-containing protein